MDQTGKAGDEEVPADLIQLASTVVLDLEHGVEGDDAEASNLAPAGRVVYGSRKVNDSFIWLWRSSPLHGHIHNIYGLR